MNNLKCGHPKNIPHAVDFCIYILCFIVNKCKGALPTLCETHKATEGSIGSTTGLVLSKPRHQTATIELPVNNTSLLPSIGSPHHVNVIQLLPIILQKINQRVVS